MKDKMIKRNRGKKISKWQETINRKNSKLRVRVEHVFGYIKSAFTECPAVWSTLRGMRPTTP